MKKKIVSVKIFEQQFPTLMKEKSGSIFLVTKWGLSYTAICLSRGEKEEGIYGIGAVLKPKELKDFKKMPAGFFIEIEVE